MKVLCSYSTIMPPLGFVFVDRCIKIAFESNLFELIQIQESCLCCGFVVEIDSFDCPICLMFNLDWEMAGLPKHQPEW